MRMWMVPPHLLCDKHLLGEHGEIHKFRHNFVKKHSMIKRITLGQIEPKSMEARHGALVKEMKERGFNHQSPYLLPDLSYIGDEYLNLKVDITKSLNDLHERCSLCKERSHI